MLVIRSLVTLPFLNPSWTSGSHGSRTVEAWLGELWALLCWHVRWVQLCSSWAFFPHLIWAFLWEKKKSMEKENMSAVSIPITPRKAHNMRTINFCYRGLLWLIDGLNSTQSAFLLLTLSWACKLEFYYFLALSPLWGSCEKDKII